MNAKAAPARRASYRDVLDAPPHMVAEIVDGVLRLQRRPGPLPALAKSALGGGSVCPQFPTWPI